jgi:bacteriocin-like protein
MENMKELSMEEMDKINGGTGESALDYDAFNKAINAAGPCPLCFRSLKEYHPVESANLILRYWTLKCHDNEIYLYPDGYVC